MAAAVWGVVLSLNKPEQMFGAVAFLVSPAALIVFIFVFTSAVTPLIVIGLPVQALLQRHRQTGYGIHAVFSVVCGALASLLLFPSVPLAALCAGIGFMAGSVAWFIRRPDKDVPKVLP